MGRSIISLFHLYEKEKLTRLVLEATNNLRNAMNSKTEESSVLSPEAQEIKELCISLGPSGSKWARICSILLKEEIIVKEVIDILPFFQFACIEIIKTSPDYSYKAKEICFELICAGNMKSPEYIKCLRFNGSVGSAISSGPRIFKIPGDEIIIEEITRIFEMAEEF